MSKITSSLAVIAALFTTASAHTRAKTWKINGKDYPGYYQGTKVDPKVVSPAWWTAQGWGLQPIYGNQISSPDFIAHKDASPSPFTAEAPAGSTVTVTWYHEGGECGSGTEQGWDCSHHGWAAAYLAPCGDNAAGDCAKVDKNSLKFFKIQEVGLTGYPAGTRYAKGEAPQAYPGKWGTDFIFYENKNQQNIKIPTSIPNGNYVLRTEVMSIHNGNEGVQAIQFWPQAANIKVTGGKDKASIPAGKKATELYTAKEPIFNFNLYWHTPATQTFATIGSQSIDPAVAASVKTRRHARDLVN
jgi:cellulase